MATLTQSNPTPHAASASLSTHQPFSLLWPAGALANAEIMSCRLSPAAWRDLGLDAIVAALASDPDHQMEIIRVLATLCQDEQVIAYRQDVLDDLLRNPGLAGRLEALLPAIDALGRYAFRVVEDQTTLSEVTWRVGELQSIVDCVNGLGSAMNEAGAGLSSQGLQALQAEVKRTKEDPVFRSLEEALPGLLNSLRTCASVTIGVNLDSFLRPVEATLLSVNEERFTSQSVLTRLFGKQKGQQGIAPLHSVPRKAVPGPYALPVSSDLGWAVEPQMVPLFRDLARVLEKITRPIARELKRYSEIHSHLFTSLRQDLIFYLGAARFARRVQAAGLPLCRPSLAPVEERVFEVEGSYNINLALRLSGGSPEANLAPAITPNDIRMGPSGRIWILTGPNQGGKTTVMQAIGITQALVQVGLPAPGVRARISPVDNIYTHFPLEEKPETEAGRFGEEAARLGDLFRLVTRHSLVLLNETLSSTSAGESLYLAQDVLRILRRMGSRAIYSTHLHELAEQVEVINAGSESDSHVVSMVSSPVDDPAAGSTDHPRSYRLEERPPLGRSYAREIARRYGVSYEQIEQVLIERGVLDNPAGE